VNQSTTLFGIDVSLLLLALLKLFADEFGFSERLVSWLRAVVIALVVLLTGLQSMGLLFGPASEPIVLLVLTVLSAFLVSKGYLPAFIGTVIALSDMIRFTAFKSIGVQMLLATKEDEKFTQKERNRRVRWLFARYALRRTLNEKDWM
jgi:hypothetical protein